MNNDEFPAGWTGRRTLVTIDLDRRTYAFHGEADCYPFEHWVAVFGKAKAHEMVSDGVIEEVA